MKTSMILVQIPTNDEEKEKKDKFYQQLRNILDEGMICFWILQAPGMQKVLTNNKLEIKEDLWERMAYKDRKKRVVCQFTIKSNVMSSVVRIVL